jgi:hypothetical protein
VLLYFQNAGAVGVDFAPKKIEDLDGRAVTEGEQVVQEQQAQQ